MGTDFDITTLQLTLQYMQPQANSAYIKDFSWDLYERAEIDPLLFLNMIPLIKM